MGEEPAIADAIGSERASLRDLTQTIPGAAAADLRLVGNTDDDVDVTVVPIREPSTPEDVELHISVGGHELMLCFAEDDMLALEDAIHQALEVEEFDE